MAAVAGVWNDSSCIKAATSGIAANMRTITLHTEGSLETRYQRRHTRDARARSREARVSAAARWIVATFDGGVRNDNINASSSSGINSSMIEKVEESW